jgi:NADH-quinone oxidoreductase subunit L
MKAIYLTVALAPLLGAVIAGLFGKTKYVGRTGSHVVTIAGVAISCALSLYVLSGFISGEIETINYDLYVWLTSGGVDFKIGFLIDPLTAVMMSVVTFVSLMVHIYTIGYMHEDPGYQRFFSYIALFTFSMLMLVMSNNFLQLFFGWEAVGLVSYLLIGFWYTRETAIFANMKAFLVNRVGDFGFLLGIAVIFYHFNSLDYAVVLDSFASVNSHQSIEIFEGIGWSVATVVGILLFVGAMGKSAQVPLHVWLPDSMEGPTPISALIHAATMVTAGIFMVARMHPIYQLSEVALGFVLVIGALTAFFMGLVGIVQNDIKRVVAYSTLSQLGYMTVALGVSAYSVAIFHLMTHAFFKALLFLAAGSVIIAMHHEQDMRKMGGLKKYMPITYFTSLVGSLALIGMPPFSGFFSKDSIIVAVYYSTSSFSSFAYVLVLAGVFITAFYSFRMFFLVFHGEERMDDHTKSHLHETPKVVTIPLIMLAIPSAIIGWMVIKPMLYGDFFSSVFSVNAISPLHEMKEHFLHGEGVGMMLHSLTSLPLWLAISGVVAAWYIYMKKPSIAVFAKEKFNVIHMILDKKFGFDELYMKVFASGSRMLGNVLWKIGDIRVIDGLMVNGSAKAVSWFSSIIRQVQTGYLFHYAFSMIIGLVLLITMFVIL